MTHFECASALVMVLASGLPCFSLVLARADATFGTVDVWSNP